MIVLILYSEGRRNESSWCADGKSPVAREKSVMQQREEGLAFAKSKDSAPRWEGRQNTGLTGRWQVDVGTGHEGSLLMASEFLERTQRGWGGGAGVGGEMRRQCLGASGSRWKGDCVRILGSSAPVGVSGEFQERSRLGAFLQPHPAAQEGPGWWRMV